MASRKHQRNGSAISVHFVQQRLNPHTASHAPAALPADPGCLASHVLTG